MRTVMNKEVAIFVSLLREWCSKSNYVHSFYQILDGKTIHHICIHTQRHQHTRVDFRSGKTKAAGSGKGVCETASRKI